ncbi:MAG: HDOD domain-containing protein [Verrucomicrobiota bacterium]|jgi:putative nucleotidyltransferase with HDIG domain
MLPELDIYINKVKNLPPAPRVLPQLLELLGQPDVDTTQVVTIIGYDPSLTANILALCNSAHFASSPEPVTDLQEAILRLGFWEIYQLVCAVTARRSLSPAQKNCGVNETALWRHSVTTAVAAQLLARDRGDDENLVFTAALLHDIGKIILAQAVNPVYTKIVLEAEQQQHALLEVEKRTLGVHHGEIGGRLLARWKFPPQLIAAVWFHHHPAAAQPHQRLAAYVHVGNLLSYFMNHGYGQTPLSLHHRDDAMHILGVIDEEIPKYISRIFQQLEKIEALLNKSGGSRPAAVPVHC